MLACARFGLGVRSMLAVCDVPCTDVHVAPQTTNIEMNAALDIYSEATNMCEMLNLLFLGALS